MRRHRTASEPARALVRPPVRGMVSPHTGPSPDGAGTFGASDSGALHLVAAWMKFLGAHDARPTDVRTVGSSQYFCGVFNSSDPVELSDLHALVGYATADGRRPIAFAAADFSEAAAQFARLAGIPLFVYHAVTGTLAARSEAAAERLRTGL